MADEKICLFYGMLIQDGDTIMLKTWCDIRLNEDTKLIEIYYDNKMVFDGNWNYPELFKLVFDENDNLINIMNIRNQII